MKCSLVDGYERFGGIFCFNRQFRRKLFTFSTKYELHIVFRNDYYMPEDRVFGSFENGKWSGLIKMLFEEEVEVIILTVMKTAARMPVADFFTPLIKTK